MPCRTCKNKICLETGKPCKKLNKKLPSMFTGKLPHTILLDGNYFNEVILYDKDLNRGNFKKRKHK